MAPSDQSPGEGSSPHLSTVPQEPVEAERLRADLQNNPVCACFVDAEVPCLTVVWQRSPTSGQLRFMHEKFLQLVREHKITKILGDDTALPWIDPEDQAWIVQNWMPRAAAAGVKVAASKSPDAYFGRLAVGSIQGSQEFLTIRAFEGFEEARRWLRDVDG